MAGMLIKNYVYHIKENDQITPLDHEDSYKDLGVTFDEKLSFRDHVINTAGRPKCCRKRFEF